MFYELVREPAKFKKLGAKFASMINAFLAPKKTALTEGVAGKALGDAFNSFFQFIDGLINGKDGEDGINWEDLKDTLKTNVEEFVKTVDLSEAGRILGDALGGLLDTFNEVFGDEKFWEELGEDLKGFMEEIPWDEIVDTAWTLLKGAITLFWSSTADTELGSFIRLVVGLSIANRISKVFTGKSVAQKIGTAFGQMFKRGLSSGGGTASEALTSGAIPGFTKLVSTIGKTVGSAAKAITTELSPALVGLGEGAALTGVVLLGTKFAEVVDEIQGGNGELTEYGGAFESVLDKLAPKLGEHKQELFLIKEDLENAGAGADEYASALRTGLEQAGISYEDADTAINDLLSNMHLTKDQADMLKSSLEGYSPVISDIKREVDLEGAGVSIEQFATAVQTHLYDLSEQVENSSTAFTGLDTACNNISSDTVSGAFEEMKGACERLNIPIDALVDVIAEEFPEAVSSGTATATTSTQKASSNIGTAFKKMETIATGSAAEIKTKTAYDFKGTEEAITGSVQGAQKETDTSFSSIDKKITDVNSEVEGDTDSQFGSLKSSAVGHITDMKDSLDKEMDEISKHMHSRFETLATFLPNHFDGIGDAVAGKFNDIPSKLQEAVNNMDASLRSIGVSIISAIQTGLLYNPIKLPHIVQDYRNPWNTYDDGHTRFSIPNFMVDWYARGGLFTTPTIAGFGEAGDEAALPLSNKGVMSRIASAIVDNSDGFGGMTQEDMVEAVATGVAMAMSQNPQTVEVVVNSVIKTSDEKLAQAVSRGRARLDQRYNATPSMA